MRMQTLEVIRHRLPLVVAGHMRIGSGAGGVLVDLYLSDLANPTRNLNAETRRCTRGDVLWR